MIAYLRRHHLAFLALFVALGGGGAYAATELGGGEVEGFSATPTNQKGESKGTLAKLAGLTLTYRSERHEDARLCTLVARTKTRGELHTHVVIQPSSGGGLAQFVGGKRFGGAGSDDVVTASFDEGAPGISRQAEGQLTWATSGGKRVATGVFHVSGESKRCAFQGTLTAAG